MKKKGLIIGIGAVVLVIALIIGGIASTYNGLVNKQENVKQAEAQIQTQLQRRAELIPNLVNTVKGYASHEDDVYTAIADARAKLNSAATPEEYKEADEAFNSAFSRLLVVVEQYPELKANENFIYLQDELSGSESRIAHERKLYNEAVADYNASRRKFPTVIFAGMLGFDEAEYFEANDSAAAAPTVNFE